MSRAFWCRQAGEKLSSAEEEFIEFEIQQKMVKIAFLSPGASNNPLPGNTNLWGRLSTVDLLIKVACFVKSG